MTKQIVRLLSLDDEETLLTDYLDNIMVVLEWNIIQAEQVVMLAQHNGTCILFKGDKKDSTNNNKL